MKSPFDLTKKRTIILECMSDVTIGGYSFKAEFTRQQIVERRLNFLKLSIDLARPAGRNKFVEIGRSRRELHALVTINDAYCIAEISQTPGNLLDV